MTRVTAGSCLGAAIARASAPFDWRCSHSPPPPARLSPQLPQPSHPGPPRSPPRPLPPSLLPMLLSSLALPGSAAAAAAAIRGLCTRCSGHMQPCLDQVMQLYAQVGVGSWKREAGRAAPGLGFRRGPASRLNPAPRSWPLKRTLQKGSRLASGFGGPAAAPSPATGAAAAPARQRRAGWATPRRLGNAARCSGRVPANAASCPPPLPNRL
jgi:hypothetical protein